jgi:hypothetical protein
MALTQSKGPEVTGHERPAAKDLPSRTRCICGARSTVAVTVEFTLDGRIEYAGGRFCYSHAVQVLVGVPPGAVLREVRVYGWHAPDELVKVTFTPQEVPLCPTTT